MSNWLRAPPPSHQAVALSGEEAALPGGGVASYPGQKLSRPKRVVCWLKRPKQAALRWEYLVEVIDNDGDGAPAFSAEQMDGWGAQMDGWELQHVNPLQELSSVLSGEPIAGSSASVALGGGAGCAAATGAVLPLRLTRSTGL